MDKNIWYPAHIFWNFSLQNWDWPLPENRFSCMCIIITTNAFLTDIDAHS